MIFRPELVDLIVAGRKTETRRPVKPGVGCRYQPGRSYAVQPGRGKRAVCRIDVRSARLECVGDIDDAAARREGFDSREGFLDYWRGLYGSMELGQKVWAIAFAVSGGDEGNTP